MNVVKQRDYIGDARKKLLQQFKGLPRIDGVLQAVMAEVQALEDAAYDVLVSRIISASPTGDLENKLGALVGQPRNGASDDDYRAYIIARIATNKSNGRHETLINIVNLLTSLTPIYFQTYLKALDITVYGYTGNAYVVWHDFLQVAKAAGDRIRFFFSTKPIENTIILDSVSGGVSPLTTQDLGSISGSYGGGYLAGVFGGF